MAGSKRKTLRPRLLVATAALVLVGAVAFAGWRWLAGVRLTHVDVVGAVHAAPEELVALARVDTSMALFDLRPDLVESRLLHHPWVRRVEATRLPTGRLILTVEERRPVALALGADGTPAFYLDADGYRIPPGDAAYDVPLVRGLSPARAVREKHPAVRALVAALGTARPEVLALVSEVTWRRPGEVWLQTVAPVGGHSIPVRLGEGGFAEKLERLHTFWHRAVLPQPERPLALIDLRFDSQVVTQEASGPPRAAEQEP